MEIELWYVILSSQAKLQKVHSTWNIRDSLLREPSAAFKFKSADWRSHFTVAFGFVIAEFSIMQSLASPVFPVGKTLYGQAGCASQIGWYWLLSRLDVVLLKSEEHSFFNQTSLDYVSSPRYPRLSPSIPLQLYTPEISRRLILKSGTCGKNVDLEQSTYTSTIYFKSFISILSSSLV